MTNSTSITNQPKRILSLDGGGIRGCLSLGYLAEIEAIVRKQLNNDKAVLSDYFDLIGGTSTGALIATMLAMGKEVEEVRDIYKKVGTKVFSKPAHWIKHIPFIGAFREMLLTKWSVKPLEEEIKKIVGEDTLLGSDVLKTGLCIVTKRADTMSTWPYINHPNGKFKENLDIPIWRILRASSAAPTYFLPIEVEVGTLDKPEKGVFVDGGVSMANNPAFQLFLVASLKGFPYHWKTSEDNLLMVSVGTGHWNRKLDRKSLLNPWNGFWGKQVPEMLMQDAGDQVELTMQYLSNSATTRPIDYEVGDLSQDVLNETPSCTYLRYNVELEIAAQFQKNHTQKNEKLAKVLEGLDEADLLTLREMDNGKNTDQLLELGSKFANEEVKAEHFPEQFAASSLKMI
jgi:patatin-like phospholipase/acyl hydrolase